MDSITQAALGGVVGELVLGRKIGWKGMAWGLFFGTLPDLDVFVSPFLDEAAKLKWHRGISHSMVAMVLAAFAFSKPLAWLHREKGLTATRAGWFVFLGWSTHVLIDVFTTYGTQIWEPFSDARVSLNNLFIIDLFFTIPLLVYVLVMLIRMVIQLVKWLIWLADQEAEFSEMKTNRKLAKYGLVLSCLYVCFSFAMKLRASEVIRARVLQEVPGGKVVQVAPTPLNTILWRGLVETREGYFITYWSPFDSDNEIPQWDYYPKYRELAEKFKGEPLFEGLVWFSRGHWVARRDQESVVLIDMRFGELRDLRTQQQYPIFQWHMRYDEDGQFVAPSYRPQELDFKNSLGMIWNRLTGDLYSWQKIRTF